MCVCGRGGGVLHSRTEDCLNNAKVMVVEDMRAESPERGALQLPCQ